ncbi:hypothetical protein D9M73_140930 [compost metagenome]
MHRARGMALGHVERGEIVPLILDLRTGRDREAQIGEDLRHFVEHLADRMDRPVRCGLGGERHVERFAREPRIEVCTVECCLARGDGVGHRLAHALDARALHQPLIGRHAAQRLEQGGDAALLAERLNANAIQRLQRGGRRDRGEQVRLHRVEVGHRVSVRAELAEAPVFVRGR